MEGLYSELKHQCLKAAHTALLWEFFCCITPPSAAALPQIENTCPTNLNKMSALHSNWPPLLHAVSEPRDVQHVHEGQISWDNLLQPLPQWPGSTILWHHVGDFVAGKRRKRVFVSFLLTVIFILNNLKFNKLAFGGRYSFLLYSILIFQLVSGECM